MYHCRLDAHLELLYRRHVVAEHALLQHGDGVALAADLLNLLAGTVAAGGQTKLLRKKKSQLPQGPVNPDLER